VGHVTDIYFTRGERALPSEGFQESPVWPSDKSPCTKQSSISISNSAHTFTSLELNRLVLHMYIGRFILRIKQNVYKLRVQNE